MYAGRVAPRGWLVCCDFAAHDADELLAACDAKVVAFDAEKFIASFGPSLDGAGRNLGGVSVGGEHYSFARGNRGVDLGEKVFSGGHLSLSLRHHRRCKDTLRDCACTVKRKMRQDGMKSERAHEMAGMKQIILDRIREILHEKPGITPGQLAEETGLAPNTITKYMRAIREEWQGRG